MLDIQSGTWIEITFIEGYEPKCTLSNILYGIMYRYAQCQGAPTRSKSGRKWETRVIYLD